MLFLWPLQLLKNGISGYFFAYQYDTDIAQCYLKRDKRFVRQRPLQFRVGIFVLSFYSYVLQ